MKTVYMIEDEILIRELFSEFLEMSEELRFLGASGSPAAGIRACEENKPDIVVLDLRLPDTNGLDVLSHLHEKLPGTRFVIFSGSVSSETVNDAMRKGVSAFVEKAYGLQELNRAMTSVARGETFFSPSVNQLRRTYMSD